MNMKGRVSPFLVLLIIGATCLLKEDYDEKTRVMRVLQNSVTTDAVITQKVDKSEDDYSSFYLYYEYVAGNNEFDHKTKFKGFINVGKKDFDRVKIGEQIIVKYNAEKPEESYAGRVEYSSLIEIMTKQPNLYLVCMVSYVLSFWGLYYFWLKKHAYICSQCNALFRGLIALSRCSRCGGRVEKKPLLKVAMAMKDKVVVGALIGATLYSLYLYFIDGVDVVSIWKQQMFD